nr:insulinase family protein [Gemmatimonadaceae bacterium]
MMQAIAALLLLGAAAHGAPGGDTEAFDVAGVRVIVRTNPANDVVAANLYLLGGTRQLTRGTQGIEALLLAASERGTRRYTREALRRAMARTASTINVVPDEDWTLVSLRTVRAELDSSWAVLADRVMAPTLAAADVELVRAQLLGAARQRVASPDAHVSHVADSVAFGAHPYALVPEGTEASLASLTLAQLRSYHATQVVRSRMLLVVVGNVTRAQVEGMVRRSLARLPRGTYEWTAPPPLPSNPGVTVVSRALPTNYILGYYAGPAATSADYAALRVASAVLAGSLF